MGILAVFLSLIIDRNWMGRRAVSLLLIIDDICLGLFFVAAYGCPSCVCSAFGLESLNIEMQLKTTQ